MNTLPQAIRGQAAGLPEGHVLSPRAFLHLGSRAAVDQAFSRLAREGALLRIRRGAYVAPVSTRFGRRTPAPQKVLESLAAQTGEALAPHGAAEANALGLTTQVPTHEVYLTSGRSRKIKLGSSELTLKQAPSWMLALGNRPAGAAVRALHWLGQPHVRRAISILEQRLPAPEWEALVKTCSQLPSWMAQEIGKANGKHSAHVG